MKEDDSTTRMLTQRNRTHGNYPEQAMMADTLVRGMELTKNWNKMDPHQRDTLRMIAVKISRILNGDHNHLDSWEDIVGYATLATVELRKKHF